MGTESQEVDDAVSNAREHGDGVPPDGRELPGATSHPLVSVIIPHLNQAAELQTCLKVLNEQTLAKNLYEVIVVDNGSDEPVRLDRHEHPNVQILVERSRGPGPARNRGVEVAKGDILAFVDADCRADPNWLRNGLRALSLSPKGTILGGRVVIWHDPTESTLTGVEAYERIFAYRQRQYIRRKGFSGTGNLVVRRADFQSIGAFAGIDIAEDIDWGERARAAGFSFCYIEEMVVAHPPRQSLRELCAKWQRQIIHSFNKARVEPYWRVRWVLRTIAVLISPCVDVFQIAGSSQISGMMARAKAIGVLIATRWYRSWVMLSLLVVRKPISWNSSQKIRP
jgi:glycosyltransferase involved in cell wall biosynthesis